MDSSKPPKIPKPPDSSKLYGQGVQDYFKYLQQFLGGEQGARQQYDPQRIAEQQGLQSQFGPTQYAQMLDAFKRLDPTYFSNREQFGNQLSNNLSGANNPYANLNAPNFNYFGGINPNISNAYSGLNANIGNQFQGINTELQAKLTPDQAREVEQQARASQVARGNASGSAGAIAEAYAKGSRGLQLGQQNLQNQWQQANYMQGANEQNFMNQMGLAGANQGVNQQNFANQMGLGSAQLGQGQANWNNLMGLIGNREGYNQQQISNMGNYLQMPSMAQQTQFVPPVSADRSFSYINPNAGYQGQQFGLQNYQNALGGAALGQQGGNSWMSSLGGLASIIGPFLGSYFGGGGYSDRRLKTDIKKIGKDEHGLNLYSFAYRGPKHIGYMADEVKKADPAHVAKDPASGYYMVSQKYAPVQVGAT